MTKKLRDWKTDVDAIRRILMSEWNPIGCRVPDDEYDGYIPQIYLLMQMQVTIDELAPHLQEIETQCMCLAERPDVNRHVAQSLLKMMG